MVSLFNLELYKKYEKIILNPTAPHSIFYEKLTPPGVLFNLELNEKI